MDYGSLYNLMLKTLIEKYGLMLTTSQTADVLAISTRTLDERRKSGIDCPEYIESNGRKIFYPVQKVVEFQLKKSQYCIKNLI